MLARVLITGVFIVFFRGGGILAAEKAEIIAEPTPAAKQIPAKYVSETIRLPSGNIARCVHCGSSSAWIVREMPVYTSIEVAYSECHASCGSCHADCRSREWVEDDHGQGHYVYGR